MLIIIWKLWIFYAKKQLDAYMVILHNRVRRISATLFASFTVVIIIIAFFQASTLNKWFASMQGQKLEILEIHLTQLKITIFC